MRGDLEDPPGGLFVSTQELKLPDAHWRTLAVVLRANAKIVSQQRLDDCYEVFRILCAGLLMATDTKPEGFWNDPYRRTGAPMIEAVRRVKYSIAADTLARIVALLGRYVMEKELPQKDFDELQALMKPILGHYGIGI